MQNIHPEPSKLGRSKRTRDASTPESGKTNLADSIAPHNRRGAFNRRVTTGPSHVAGSQPNLPRRRLGLNRTSIFPTQGQLDSTRLVDTENNDTESMLLYDEYLQSIMLEVILKKKAEERKRVLLSQLATIAKECDQHEVKLFKLKTRERDIVNLTMLQNKVDAQAIDANNITKNDEVKTIEKTLSKIYSIVQPLDVLRCENMILPLNPEEWKETEQALQICAETLNNITKLIGTNKDTYIDLSNTIKEFLQNYNDIVEHHKKLEKELHNMQVLTLKTVSLSLTQNQD